MPKDTRRSRSISLLSILGPAHRRRRVACRPRLEPLEGRALLATFNVTSLADSGPKSIAPRAAIAAANDPSNTDPANEIDFDSSLRGGTINLTTFRNDSTGIFPGPTALVVSSDITIVGSGQTIQRSAASGTADFRILFVTGTGNLTLQDLTLSNGDARGGDGDTGGGGAAGLGGAVFNQGTLALQRVTLSGNQAIGGNGGDGGDFALFQVPPNSTGGGGGLGGSASGSDGGGPNGGTSSGEMDGGFGGGGGGSNAGGGNGGFGGGGGAGGEDTSSSHGGFGGGGGATQFVGDLTGTVPQTGGFGGGNGDDESYGGGGGGAGLGGAIFNDQGGMLTVTNSTLSGNSAQGGNGGVLTSSNGGTGEGGLGGSGYGAAVFNRNGTVVINSSTLAGNTVTPGRGGYGRSSIASTGGGAVYNLLLSGTAAALTLKNSILAGSGTGVTDLVNDGGSVSGGSNLVQSQSGVPNGVISLTTDPKLGPLKNYGGLTQTRALLPGSPAIDAGTSTGANIPATDQRGLGRVGAIDIGAFESQGFTLTTSPASTPANPLKTAVGTSFGDLIVTAKANNPNEPVAGGVVTFTVPTNGASATLTVGNATGSTVSGTLGANGQTQVGAAANTITGAYTVTASAAAATSATFYLANTPGASDVGHDRLRLGTVGDGRHGLRAPLVVVVTDTYGNPVPGAIVTFAAPTSGGRRRCRPGRRWPTTRARASVTAMANTVAGGPYTVTASVSGLTASFSLTNTPGAPTSVTIVSGSGQSATVGNGLRQPAGGSWSGTPTATRSPPRALVSPPRPPGGRRRCRPGRRWPTTRVRSVSQ